MPSGMAAEMRDFVAAMSAADRDALVLERSPWSNTGFINVIKVKNKFQARLQVPGDGRGGTKKRKQCSLPGLFDTAEEAAIHLAAYKKALKKEGEPISSPVKLDKKHKKRAVRSAVLLQPPRLVEPQQQPMATAMATPLYVPMFHVPFATVSPLPMQPIGYVPPRF